MSVSNFQDKQDIRDEITKKKLHKKDKTNKIIKAMERSKLNKIIKKNKTKNKQDNQDKLKINKII